jgi:hypothetical protein
VTVCVLLCDAAWTRRVSWGAGDKFETARDLLKVREGDIAGCAAQRKDRPAAIRGRLETPLERLPGQRQTLTRQPEDDDHRGRARAVVPRPAHGDPDDGRHPRVCQRASRGGLRQRHDQPRAVGAEADVLARYPSREAAAEAAHSDADRTQRPKSGSSSASSSRLSATVSRRSTRALSRWPTTPAGASTARS